MKVDRIDLFPHRQQQKKPISAIKLLAPCLALSLLAAFVATGMKYPKVRSKELQLIAATTELGQIRREVASIQSDGKQELKTKQVGLVHHYVERKIRWSDLLKEISLLTPEQIWLTNFSGKIEKETLLLSMTAEALSQKEMSDFISTLENSHHFRNIKFKFSEHLSTLLPSVHRFQLESLMDLETFREQEVSP